MKTAVAGASMPDDGRAEWPEPTAVAIGAETYFTAPRDELLPIFRTVDRDFRDLGVMGIWVK